MEDTDVEEAKKDDLGRRVTALDRTVDSSFSRLHVSPERCIFAALVLSKVPGSFRTSFLASPSPIFLYHFSRITVPTIQFYLRNDSGPIWMLIQNVSLTVHRFEFLR